MSQLPPFEDPRAVLSRHGLRPKKSFSQNFLTSERAVTAIAAAVPETARVVELGPGVGTLTAALLRRGLEVTAIERDPAMRRVLATEFSTPALEVLDGDAAALDVAALRARCGGTLHLVGNLPYAITGAIFRAVVDAYPAVDSAVFMVQSEVRDRLVAEPGTGAYGALTAFTSAVYAVERVVEVPRGCFHPPPNVDSSVVRLVRLDPPRAVITETYTRVVRGSFEQRRKMLRGALRTLAPREVLEAACQEASVSPEERGERLSVERFAALAAALDARR